VIRVAVVLDASALISYSQLRLPVPELLMMLAEEGVIAGVPAGSFTAAFAAADDDGRQELIRLVEAADRVVEILPLRAVDTVDAARIDAALGLAGLGHAIIAARDHDAVLATHEVTAAVRALPISQVHDLGFDDA
jgi:hypothetical protein